MYNKDHLKKQLAEMGLKPTDAVMIHSSIKAMGPVEGGADTILDALMEYFAEGLLMMPTHTWAQMSDTYNVFDPATEKSCVGTLSNLFRQRPGVVRSLHPTHSIAAYGPEAESYVAGEENITTPCGPEGCWGRLAKVGAKILLLGVIHNRNTFVHSVEEMCQVPERLTAEPVTFQIKMPDGQLKPVAMYRHYNPYTNDISQYYVKLTDAFYETGAAKKATLGDAACILCDAAKVAEVTAKVLNHNSNCFLECEEIPAEWYL